MPPIFNNKKVYLRRKSLRLQSQLFYLSIPFFLGLGMYALYNRSPNNVKYLNAYSQSINTISDRTRYYGDRVREALGLSDRHVAIREPQNLPKKQIQIVRNEENTTDSNSE